MNYVIDLLYWESKGVKGNVLHPRRHELCEKTIPIWLIDMNYVNCDAM